MTSHPQLRDERVVVLGGAGLIGSAICSELSALGASVVAVDIDADALARLDHEAARPYRCDATDPAQKAALVDSWKEEPPRYFVHSATGQTEEWGFPDPFAWFAHHDIHLYSPIELAGRLLELRHAKGLTGSAVFISSIHARLIRNAAVYSSAKAALEMAARELAFTVAEHGSRANCVAPGHVSADPEPSRPSLLTGESMRPDAIAKSVRFLLCDDCSPATTGSMLQVDGGLSLWAPWGRT